MTCRTRIIYQKRFMIPVGNNWLVDRFDSIWAVLEDMPKSIAVYPTGAPIMIQALNGLMVFLYSHHYPS